jgi:hypothetical protein
VTRPARCQLLPLLLAGCGYTTGYEGIPPGVRTVAVEVVANDTWWQRREIPLTRAVVAALSEHAGKAPAPRAAADARLLVTIEDVHTRPLVGGTPLQEGSVRIAVHVRLVGRDGATLRERRILDQAEFRTPVGETLAGAERESLQDLARKIVLALEADF